MTSICVHQGHRYFTSWSFYFFLHCRVLAIASREEQTASCSFCVRGSSEPGCWNPSVGVSTVHPPLVTSGAAPYLRAIRPIMVQHQDFWTGRRGHPTSPVPDCSAGPPARPSKWCSWSRTEWTALTVTPKWRLDVLCVMKLLHRIYRVLFSALPIRFFFMQS